MPVTFGRAVALFDRLASQHPHPVGRGAFSVFSLKSLTHMRGVKEGIAGTDGLHRIPAVKGVSQILSNTFQAAGADVGRDGLLIGRKPAVQLPQGDIEGVSDFTGAQVRVTQVLFNIGDSLVKEHIVRRAPGFV